MRSVHVTIEDRASGVKATFAVSLNYPRHALLYDVQQEALMAVYAKWFGDDERREKALAARRRFLREANKTK